MITRREVTQLPLRPGASWEYIVACGDSVRRQLPCLVPSPGWRAPCERRTRGGAREGTDRTPVIVVEEIAVTRFGRWFIRRYIEPSAETARARAPRKIAPGAMVDAAILDRFFAGNDETRLVIARAGHHDVNRIRFVNPFVPLLRFTVGTGLEIVTGHQRRHLLQAERIKELRDFPREDSR